MKNLFATIFVLTLYGCAYLPSETDTPTCVGSSTLPASLATKFEAVEDKQLLTAALGRPNKGKLCQGQVYKSKTDTHITLFRAWNSTNPTSKFGKWWAFHQPVGKISTYRSDFEICFQFSPLDMLVSCSLKPGSKIVVGTGQSAECSEYLTYPVSNKQQIYIDNASTSLDNCTLFDGEFSWKKL